MRVLIITSSIDYTVDYIISRYASVDFYRFNVDMFDEYRVIITNDGWRIESNSGVIAKDDVNSIYYRKPMLPDLSQFQHVYRGMIESDILGLITGLVDSFEGVVISKPYLLRRAENKIYQLQVLRNIGVPFPNSLLGNVRDMDVYLKSDNKIIKPISYGKIDKGDTFEFFQTNELTRSVGDIALTPVYLQEKIVKDFEVRITCIDDYLWPVRIDTDARIDWRNATANNKYSLIKIPLHIKKLCKDVLQLLDLRFGAFDFIVQPDGRWIYLEVNPNGQWLWLEKILNLDISKRLVELLSEKGGSQC